MIQDYSYRSIKPQIGHSCGAVQFVICIPSRKIFRTDSKLVCDLLDNTFSCNCDVVEEVIPPLERGIMFMLADVRCNGHLEVLEDAISDLMNEYEQRYHYRSRLSDVIVNVRGVEM